MLLDYFNRLESLDYLIRTKSTGSPSALARRLGISERTLYDYLDAMKALGAPIGYSKRNQSYYYKEKGEFCLKFRKETPIEEEECPDEDPYTVKKTMSRLIAYDIPICSDLIMMLG
jgi:hypothetical protein